MSEVSVKKLKSDIPPLTKEQQKMVEENMPLVDWYIKRSNAVLFKREKEDFRHELYIALMIAVSTYDSSKGKLSTHAEWQFRAAKSKWVEKNLRFKRSLTFDIAFGDLEEETNMLSIETTDERREVEVLREVIMNLSEYDRMNLPIASKLFKDYNKKLRRKESRCEMKKLKAESESVLRLLDLMRQRGV